MGGDNNNDNDDDRQPTQPSSRKNDLKAQTNIIILNFIGKKSYYITKKGLSFLIHYKINSIKFSVKEKNISLKEREFKKPSQSRHGKLCYLLQLHSTYPIQFNVMTPTVLIFYLTWPNCCGDVANNFNNVVKIIERLKNRNQSMAAFLI